MIYPQSRSDRRRARLGRAAGRATHISPHSLTRYAWPAPDGGMLRQTRLIIDRAPHTTTHEAAAEAVFGVLRNRHVTVITANNMLSRVSGASVQGTLAKPWRMAAAKRSWESRQHYNARTDPRIVSASRME